MKFEQGEANVIITGTNDPTCVSTSSFGKVDAPMDYDQIEGAEPIDYSTGWDDKS